MLPSFNYAIMNLSTKFKAYCKCDNNSIVFRQHSLCQFAVDWITIIIVCERFSHSFPRLEVLQVATILPAKKIEGRKTRHRRRVKSTSFFIPKFLRTLPTRQRRRWPGRQNTRPTRMRGSRHSSNSGNC